MDFFDYLHTTYSYAFSLYILFARAWGCDYGFKNNRPLFDLSDGAGEPRFDGLSVCTLCVYTENVYASTREIPYIWR